MRRKLFIGLAAASALVYACALYYMLFGGFGRVNVLVSENMALHYSYNLMPFKTIAGYTAAAIDGSIRGHAIRNLLGNLLLLMPLGFYLPFFIKKTAHAVVFAVTSAVLIAAIEVTQMLTMRGSLDVDDFILNFLGALIGFVVFRFMPLKRLFGLRMY